jgi:hypothetical protein
MLQVFEELQALMMMEARGSVWHLIFSTWDADQSVVLPSCATSEDLRRGS